MRLSCLSKRQLRQMTNRGDHEVSPYNPVVRRLLAVCLLVLFASLATTDAIACPDGCQSADSQSAADHCNATGACVFCSAAVVAVAAPITFAPVTTRQPAPLPLALTFPASSGVVLDHPPRVS